MTEAASEVTVRDVGGWPSRHNGADLEALRRAIVQAVVYGDIFDYPLTAREIYRYLVEVRAPLAAIDLALHDGSLVPRHLSAHDGYYTLPGREAIIATRQRRAEVAATLWPRAQRYGRLIARLPFVRMVAVTGALAMDNVEPAADIDYLIVTEPGRLWLCRAIVILLVRAAALRGDTICPNYFLSERALVLNERNLFAAHELAHMVPLAGVAIYTRMRSLNSWTERFLPNAGGPPRQVRATDPGGTTRRVAEAALRSRLGERIETWEMLRKIEKFSAQSQGRPEASFSADWCKGHFESYGERALRAFAERWQKVAI